LKATAVVLIFVKSAFGGLIVLMLRILITASTSCASTQIDNNELMLWMIQVFLFSFSLMLFTNMLLFEIMTLVSECSVSVLGMILLFLTAILGGDDSWQQMICHCPCGLCFLKRQIHGNVILVIATWMFYTFYCGKNMPYHMIHYIKLAFFG
jgi:hypothetical protein